MPALDLSEVFAQLRTDLLDDHELAALLGETNGIFREWPQGAHRKPFILITFDNLNPQTVIDGVGVYRPDVSFDVIVINPWDAGPIYHTLESRWTIPKERSSPIVSTNFVIDILQFSDMIEVTGRPLEEVDTGQQVRQFTITASMRITVA